MMAIGFCNDYLRFVSPTSSRVGYKLTEIMRMQADQDVIFIPTRDRMIDPIRSAYEYTCTNPEIALLGQAIDLATENCRLLGVAYNVIENKIRLIYSRATESIITSGKIPKIDVIRYYDMDLTEQERFTYTFMTMNTWNFVNVRSFMDLTKNEFEEMFKASASTLNGAFQIMVDLNAFKALRVNPNSPLQISHGVLTEAQMFYDLDINSGLKHYATVSTNNYGDELSEMILNEFLSTVPEVKSVKKIKQEHLVLNV